ncbi:MAG: hypothetical protein J6D52_02560 [Clostridia bacterium]|nr:hypothetical protein [Clostridia bacterium]
MLNKRGDGYIWTCVLVVALCMIIAALVTFTSAVSVIRMTEKNSKIVLDSFVMKNSILIYDSIKNGNDYTFTLDEDEYIDDLCEFCTFENNGEFLYAYTSEGKLKYKISKPTVSFSSGTKLKIFANYMVYYPIDFNGAVVYTAEIPITVESKFNEKF